MREQSALEVVAIAPTSARLPMGTDALQSARAAGEYLGGNILTRLR